MPAGGAKTKSRALGAKPAKTAPKQMSRAEVRYRNKASVNRFDNSSRANEALSSGVSDQTILRTRGNGRSVNRRYKASRNNG